MVTFDSLNLSGGFCFEIIKNHSLSLHEFLLSQSMTHLAQRKPQIDARVVLLKQREIKKRFTVDSKNKIEIIKDN